MKLNLLSLAPDSFILGPNALLSQFYPKKIFNILNNTLRSFPATGCDQGALPYINPWGVEIHLTSHCQLDCSRCSYGRRNKEDAELTSDMVQKVLASVGRFHFESVIFSGGGDPLAWTAGNFNEVLKPNASYSQSIATNGLGLMSVLDKSLLSRLDIIQINVNGYDKRSYLEVAGKDLFDPFYENMQWLFKHRDKRRTQVTGKILLDNQNYLNIKEYLKFCHEMDFDLVVIKLAGNFEPGQHVSLDQEQKKELRELIYESSVIGEYPKKLDAISTDDNSTEIDLPRKCWVVEYGLYMLIRSNGDVFPCVASPYTRENSIGNLNQDTLESIWNSKKHRAIKDKLSQDMQSCRCNLNVCRHMRYNVLLDKTLCASQYIKQLPKTKQRKPTLL